MNRSTVLAAACVAAIVVAGASGGLAAQAAEPVVIPVSTAAELVAALGPNCIVDSVVVAQSFVIVTDRLVVSCTTTLDLSNSRIDALGGTLISSGVIFTIATRFPDARFTSTEQFRVPSIPRVRAGISLSPDSELIVQSGHVIATGTVGTAGIGSQREFEVDSGGRVTVLGGTVDATGDRAAAGIGGSYQQSFPLDLVIAGGTVNATGGAFAAGVGHGTSRLTAIGTEPTVLVSGGTLNARGGEQGAGVGGSGCPCFRDDSSFSVAVTGGTVNAFGGAGGAGIGGGYGSWGWDVSVSGGTVTATGGDQAPGIGAGLSSDPDEELSAGSLTTTGGVVTAIAGAGSAAIGTTTGQLADQRGALLLIDSDVYIGSGYINASSFSAVTVGTNGRLMGSPAAPAAGFILGASSLLNPYFIPNDGVIAFPLTHLDSGVVIQRNNFLVSFDLAGGSGAVDPLLVFAPTIASSFQPMPANPTRTGYFFNGWMLQGQPFTADTPIPSSGLTATAQWINAADTVAAALGAECVPGATWALPQDATITTRVSVSCDMTLDLNGHDLATDGIDVAPGADFTVSDSVTGGSLTASSTGSTPAIDAGSTEATLTIAAKVYIGTGSLLPAAWGSLTLTPSGHLLGSPLAPTDGNISGPGTIVNNGVIGIRAANIDARIAIRGHNYLVGFTDAGATGATSSRRVFAPTLNQGFQSLPTSPVWGIDRFDGWMLGATVFTATTPLPGASSSGAAVPVTVAAAWTPGTANLGSDLSAVAGALTAFTPRLTSGDGLLVSTDPAAWNIDAPTSVSVSRDAVSGEVSVSSTAAGTFTVTGTYTAGGVDYTDTVLLTVGPGAPTALSLTFTGRAIQGNTITVTTISRDAFGNRINDVSSEVTLVSSVATDSVVGSTVTFAHASPHTITATHLGADITGSLLIEVIPAGTVRQLADTGTPEITIWLALLAIAAIIAGMTIAGTSTAGAGTAGAGTKSRRTS